MYTEKVKYGRIPYDRVWFGGVVGVVRMRLVSDCRFSVSPVNYPAPE